MDNIVLIGFMGSGKTGVGRELARLLSIPFYDMDEMLEQEAGMPIDFRNLPAGRGRGI